ncbi:MAG: histidine triad nucleotide-binding protein [Candidatus Abawacabacteria bacterium]|nr:histidine triad nucleotide-binding protein [Candidatus Abawacabacteria bacterium]
MDCIFCKIVAKTVPAKVIYEDDLILVFHDIAPSAPTHILFIPKKHIQSLHYIEEGDKELLSHLLLRIKQIAQDVGIAAAGYRVQTNIGRDGGQVVPHLHWHLLGGKKL